MKDIQRYVLLAAIFVVLFLLLLEWKKFDAQRNQSHLVKQQSLSTTRSESITTTSNTTSVKLSTAENDIPVATDSSSAKSEPAHQTSSNLIDIATDVLNLKIDPVGGDIVMVSLPAYWASLDTPEIPFELLNRTTENLYIAQSGLIGTNGIDRSSERPVFGSEKQSYVLSEGNNELIVTLFLPEKNGVKINKQFIFHRGQYLVEIKYLVENKTSKSWEGAFFGQIKRDDSTPKSTTAGLQPFLGAAITTPEKHYEKMKFSAIEKEPFKEAITGGWVAFVQHYFISAWVANPDQENTYRIKKLSGDNIFVLGYTGQQQTIAPQTSGEFSGHFYAGPKITQRLEEISPYLDLTVDYGWLWWVAKPIHWVLQTAHKYINNWGWSIITLTLFIKLLLFPLSNKAYISMGHMRKVAPKMAAIKEQCGDNRQKLQEEMMKLYRTEKINPLGGCLPMVLQMPVFISLYWVLMESVELRHAPFMGWIHDLSVMDPYFCLPILMGLSMFFQQKMNPAPPDPMQAKVMQFLPIIFTFMFLWFPAGLVLYWLVNNLFSMTHQAYINKKVEAGAL